MTRSAKPAVLEFIVSGFTGKWVADRVRGYLPDGWRISHGPKALDDLVGGVVLTAAAEGPDGLRAGAKVCVAAERLAAGDTARAKLIEDLLSELALSLRRDCDARSARASARA